ncbi:unnamed protein product, partial [Mesorhabditis belari]|uniref:Uncharacterized protein n=1 Tax=Mesorhabditis belari TaxID=2138241 RepID=A0AAF3FC98_9BILA
MDSKASFRATASEERTATQKRLLRQPEMKRLKLEKVSQLILPGLGALGLRIAGAEDAGHGTNIARNMGRPWLVMRYSAAIQPLIKRYCRYVFQIRIFANDRRDRVYPEPTTRDTQTAANA